MHAIQQLSQKTGLCWAPRGIGSSVLLPVLLPGPILTVHHTCSAILSPAYPPCLGPPVSPASVGGSCSLHSPMPLTHLPYLQHNLHSSAHTATTAMPLPHLPALPTSYLPTHLSDPDSATPTSSSTLPRAILLLPTRLFCLPWFPRLLLLAASHVPVPFYLLFAYARILIFDAPAGSRLYRTPLATSTAIRIGWLVDHLNVSLLYR